MVDTRFVTKGGSKLNLLHKKTSRFSNSADSTPDLASVSLCFICFPSFGDQHGMVKA
jgi:hypothetical protein